MTDKKCIYYGDCQFNHCECEEDEPFFRCPDRKIAGESGICDVCNGYNYILLGCCSGRDGGCLGLPVDSKPCYKCNPYAAKEPSAEAKNEWPWCFG